MSILITGFIATLFLIQFGATTSSYQPNLSEIICTNVTGKPCEGSMLYAFGQVKIPHPPKLKFQYSTPEQCEANCTKTPWCQMAMYLAKSRKHHHSACYLYTEVSFSTHGTNRTIIYWACCKKTMSNRFPYDDGDSLIYIPDNERCRAMPGRCKGHWTKSERYLSPSSTSRPTYITNSRGPRDCIQHCDIKEGCTRIFYREKDGTCMIPRVEEKSKEINKTNRWELYEWECC